MIIKAKERGNGRQLGAYLLQSKDNEHVSVHQVRGFMSDDVPGAMQEADAIAKGTRCKQHLFSISINPPPSESVRTEAFDHALSLIEERTGLAGQPRIVVFHEKEGRRHCHAVWSRIDPKTMTAVQLSFYKNRLREVSKQLFLEHGFQMPRGLVDSRARDPRSFSQEEWQHAKRIGRDAGDLKAILQECWASSDSGAAFAKALEERGLYLARGDRRGHVALTYEGHAISVARYVGKKVKDITARLGSSEDARSIEETKSYIAQQIAPRLDGLLSEAESRQCEQMALFDEQRARLKIGHADERGRLHEGQRLRAEAEGRERAERMRKGLAGLWDRLTGEHARLKASNELQAFMALRRDRDQREAMLAAQLEERQRLQAQIRAARHQHLARMTELHRDLARQRAAQAEPNRLNMLRDSFSRQAQSVGPQDRLAALQERRGRPRGGPSLER